MEVSSPPAIASEINEEHEKTLKLLRRDWKWAAASDFLYKFNPMLRLDFLNLSDVEHDIIRGTSDTMMNVLLKILHVLTSIRGLSPDTWEQYLRRLYARREPDNTIWGTEEEPKAWVELGWQNRLEVLYNLCEWNFQNPLRVRQSMKDDSDDYTWRTVPIGKDVKRNEYWQLGRDRLWIKRPTAEPMPPKDLKRKRQSRKAAEKPSKKAAGPNGVAKPAPVKGKRKGKEPQKQKPQQRAESNPKAKVKVSTSKAKPAPKPAAPSGTRLSSRLARGANSDGWQKVPEEWLPEGGKQDAVSDKDNASVVSALFDDASDLTDLSDDEKPREDSGTGSSKANPPDDSESDLTDIDELSNDSDAELANKAFKMDLDPNDPNFVEFETICVTKGEWVAFAEQFQSSRSHNERRLYRYIIEIIVPEMEEHQRALEEKQKKDLKDMLRREAAAAAAAAAEARPKRSSRLATLGDEEKRAQDSAGSVDGDSSDFARGPRPSRMRRAAVRGARWIQEQEEMLAAMSTEQEENEEDEGVEREGEEGTQKKRRKAKVESDQEEYRDDEDEEVKEEIVETVNSRGRPRRAAAVQADLKRPIKPTRRRRIRDEFDDDFESDDPFFLNCEICKKSGWNEDRSQNLISCRDCSIWQHMACYDRADRIEGRPKRNWEEEPFVCSACLVKAQNKRPKRNRRAKDASPSDEHEDEQVPINVDQQVNTGEDAMVTSPSNEVSTALNGINGLSTPSQTTTQEHSQASNDVHSQSYSMQIEPSPSFAAPPLQLPNGHSQMQPNLQIAHPE